MSGSGDILVFQKKLLNEKPEIFEWDGLQAPSQGDGTDPRLGGRPLPTVSSYYDCLAYIIKMGFKDKYPVGTTDEGKSIFFEPLRLDKYGTARRGLAGVLGEDIDCAYVRFFSHDFDREASGREPLRLGNNDQLQRVVPMHNLVNDGQTEYRTLWYEQTEYHISEFDQKDKRCQHTVVVFAPENYDETLATRFQTHPLQRKTYKSATIRDYVLGPAKWTCWRCRLGFFRVRSCRCHTCECDTNKDMLCREGFANQTVSRSQRIGRALHKDNASFTLSHALHGVL